MDLIRDIPFESPLLVIPLIYFLGVITSLSPCILALMPMVLAYIGGYGKDRKTGLFMSLFFVMGLGFTFAILGMVASYLGTIFGQVSSYWYVLAALISMAMGLHVLGIIHVTLPGLKRLPFRATSPLGAVLLGLTFGLVSSPCSTPVLAAILSFVAVQQRILYGGILLFIYGVGQGTPLILLGTFASLLKELPYLQQRSRIFSYTSGSLLILLGFYLLYSYY